MKLRHWYAVHSPFKFSQPPQELLDSIRPSVDGLECDFEIANGTWTTGGFRMSSAAGPILTARRILPGEEGFLEIKGIEQLLNGMSDEPHRDYVLSHIQKTRQTITLTPIPTTLRTGQLARICEQLCGCLARASSGLIHVYQKGFFSCDGDSLLPHSPRHRLNTT